MAIRTEGRATDKNPLTVLSELKDLILAYVKQETIEPLKGLLRFVAYGIGGTLLLSIGLLLWVLALLRALQTETGSTFAGNLTWAPYLITVVGSAVVAGLAARAIGSAKRKAKRTGTVG